MLQGAAEVPGILGTEEGAQTPGHLVWMRGEAGDPAQRAAAFIHQMQQAELFVHRSVQPGLLWHRHLPLPDAPQFGLHILLYIDLPGAEIAVGVVDHRHRAQIRPAVPSAASAEFPAHPGSHKSQAGRLRFFQRALHRGEEGFLQEVRIQLMLVGRAVGVGQMQDHPVLGQPEALGHRPAQVAGSSRLQVEQVHRRQHQLNPPRLLHHQGPNQQWIVYAPRPPYSGDQGGGGKTCMHNVYNQGWAISSLGSRRMMGVVLNRRSTRPRIS